MDQRHPHLLGVLFEEPELEALVQFELPDVPHLVKVLPGGVQLIQQTGHLAQRVMNTLVNDEQPTPHPHPTSSSSRVFCSTTLGTKLWKSAEPEMQFLPEKPSLDRMHCSSLWPSRSSSSTGAFSTYR